MKKTLNNGTNQLRKEITRSSEALSWITFIASESWGTVNAGILGFRSKEDINPIQKKLENENCQFE